MSIFDKIKDIQKLKELDNEFAKQTFNGEKEGVKVILNGRGEIISLALNPNLAVEKQEQILKELINEVSQRAKMEMAQKTAQLTGLKF
ncbi:MAG TPA: YbaB/EbfC family nucleoid-associated protein [Candidatus Pacearchaeota archaeon]|jgi:DNA-binding protein YbaB|nr:YbaB/EbfC family nucleoid-associated protein [Candidatus Pacearchaeota archaeon]HRR95067.1 YbaB/EbfC family nucleoid-associated protein [Candidatus Paceibacterota bacterium]HPC30555.1 YbaB/EbfC family nucleoid-associated protein [Candidatus Pacearchaeota archaeon]HQG09434.1 YbaB/EbfC family nucleoid-associated protein [Candidatus Pacearchaeota archaeon]HQH20361.1 YbaB/EbfC family nucleoid-associated protein [Candidatus Pacearchaeota archaeon]